jgi:hypothetical protein
MKPTKTFLIELFIGIVAVDLELRDEGNDQALLGLHLQLFEGN